jgi:hypothetical protein
MSVSSGAISIKGNAAFCQFVALPGPHDETADAVRGHFGCLADHAFERASTEVSVQE